MDNCRWKFCCWFLSTYLADISWNGQQWVVVGYPSTIHTSSDGINWQSQSSVTSNSLNSISCDSAQRIRHAIEAAQSTLYRFNQLKSKKDTTRRPLRKIVLTVSNRRDLADGEQAVREGMAITQGITLAKDLGNMPGIFLPKFHP